MLKAPGYQMVEENSKYNPSYFYQINHAIRKSLHYLMEGGTPYLRNADLGLPGETHMQLWIERCLQLQEGFLLYRNHTRRWDDVHVQCPSAHRSLPTWCIFLWVKIESKKLELAIHVAGLQLRWLVPSKNVKTPARMRCASHMTTAPSKRSGTIASGERWSPRSRSSRTGLSRPGQILPLTGEEHEYVQVGDVWSPYL